MKKSYKILLFVFLFLFVVGVIIRLFLPDLFVNKSESKNETPKICFSSRKYVTGTGECVYVENCHYVFPKDTKKCFGLNNGEWNITTLGNNVISVTSVCNNKKGNISKDWNQGKNNIDWSKNSKGNNCWCKVTKFTSSDGALQNLSSPLWKYTNGYSNNSNCAKLCAEHCLADADLDFIVNKDFKEKVSKSK